MTTTDVAPRGWHSRGYLPHIDGSQMLQFVSFLLADSVPAELVERWKAEILRSETNPQMRTRELLQRIERYADQGAGECLLAYAAAAKIAQAALLRFDGERYRLIAWVIMPNHVHVLIETGDATGSNSSIPFHALPKIIQSWKSYSAKAINTVLNRTGNIWMREYFDRFIRDPEHYDRVVNYIHRNPVSAGLCNAAEDWPWSSAARRISA